MFISTYLLLTSAATNEGFVCRSTEFRLASKVRRVLTR
jgi:hypothetical protein